MDQDENRAELAEVADGAQEIQIHVQPHNEDELELHDVDLQMQVQDENGYEEIIDNDAQQIEMHVQLHNENDLQMHAEPVPEESEDEDGYEEIIDYDSSSSNSSWTESMSSARSRSDVSVENLAPTKGSYSFKPLQLKKCDFDRKYLINSFGTLPCPLPRSGHRIVATESNLYSLGGYNPANLPVSSRGNCKLYQELWSYNFATNTWKLMLDVISDENMPKEMASNALAIHNNVLISHGGTGYPFGETCVNDCYVYTTGEKPLFTRLNVTGDMPTAQYGSSIVIHDNHLYTIGGTTGFEYFCDVYRLNLSTKVWKCVHLSRPQENGDPEGRYRHEIAYDGAHIYVLGGGTASSVHDMKRIPAFNLNTNRWDYFDALPDQVTSEPHDNGFPLARKCFSCVQHTKVNGDVEAFIAGGLQGQLYFSDIWKLNLRTMQWTKIQTAKLPQPLFFHSGTHAGNGCMYIFGGIECKQNEMRRRNDLYKMWMTIPKLSEICWDAISHYSANLANYDRESLLKMGIPERFVARVACVRTRRHPPGIRPGCALFLAPKKVRFNSVKP